LVASTSDGYRMIQQGAVRLGVDAQTLEKITDRDLTLRPGRYLAQVGKHRFCWIDLRAQIDSQA
jgi:hypothetical protein